MSLPSATPIPEPEKPARLATPGGVVHLCDDAQARIDGTVHSRSEDRSSYDGAAAMLGFAAASLNDIESLRIATANRLRSLLMELGAPVPEAASAGALVSLANTLGSPFTSYGSQLAALMDLEHQATLVLQRAMREHPLGDWVARTVGIGEKQGARLIASIGPISWRDRVLDRETGEVLEEARKRRGPAELWGYCGYKPGQRRQRGVQSNWNQEAKMRARLCAESCIKQRHSPYRAEYDRARESWAEHDTSDLHKHQHALRRVAKQLLKDLFLEARRLGV